MASYLDGNTLLIGANIVINSIAYFVGNSTVNTVITSPGLVAGPSSINTLGVFIGNSTVNLSSNSLTLIVANSTAQVAITSSAVNVQFASVTAGPNLTINSSGLYWGNSTVNSVSNSTVDFNSNPTGVLTVGANFINISANAASVLYLGNTTVNATINSTAYTLNGNKIPNTISVAVFMPGLPSGNAIARVSIAANCKFAASLTGSQAYCKNLATSSCNVVLNYINSGSSTATANINFGTGSHIGSFTMTSQLSVFAGDTLEFQWPASADATLTDIAITLLGNIT
jgi:hypothetical protein